MNQPKSWTYAKAGVDVDRGNTFVQNIRKLVKQTGIPGAIGNIGGFSGFFDPSACKISNPLLVGTTDGVGTKLEIAQGLGQHDTVGIDLVAMCVNDLICTGARPLFFLDYFACGKLDLKIAQNVMKGIVKGCRDAGCALIGGETAEMPDFYPGKRYDLAGFAVGLVDKKKVVDGKKIRKGDLLIGLASSGFHSNGFSLLRRLFSKEEMEGTWGKKLLIPTRIYVKQVLALLEKVELKGIAHVTGGAFIDKIPRIIPKGLCAEIHAGSWPVPEPFLEVEKRGWLSQREMFRTFNMGVGMVLVTAPQDAAKAQRILAKFKMKSWVIGKIARAPAAGEKVVLKGAGK